MTVVEEKDPRDTQMANPIECRMAAKSWFHQRKNTAYYLRR
ncbi:hypothetical protein [Pantanalinema sp. GBBB05]